MKGMWVGYDVGCTMGLTCGQGAWQIDRQSNGSMWNSYSFQPVGQWMSYSFTDLGAEGCCRSLNALLLSLCKGNPPVTSGFHSQRASNMSFLFVICECKYSFQIRKLFEIKKISHTNSSVGSLIVLIRKTSFENLVIYPRIIHVHGLMQDNINSIAQALELLQSCTKPLMYSLVFWWFDIFDLI